MPFENEALLPELIVPSFPGPDRTGVVEQAVLLLLFRQPLEFRAKGMGVLQEGLFAMKDRRVSALAEYLGLQLPRSHAELHGADQGRMRVGVELWVGQIGDLPRETVELDDVGVLDFSQVARAQPS